jgi:single-strand DNA-binding protein
MSNLNRIVLIGTVQAKPETRFAADSGLSVSKFTLSVARPPRQDGQTEYDNIPILAFGRTADYTAENVQAASAIIVEGKIQTSQTESNGVKQWITEVNAGVIRTIGAGQTQKAQPAVTSVSSAPPETAGNPFAETTEDDVPF